MIIPAVLASSWRDLQTQIEKISGLCETIHVDYVDGKLVKGKTLDWQEILEVPKYFQSNIFEFHLMAQESISIALEAGNNGFTKVIIQVESLDNEDVQNIEELSDIVSIYLALKPQTGIETIEPFLDFIEGVTIMTVEPGAQGRKFSPKALTKISALKEMGFMGEIEIDGSVNLETIDLIVKEEVDSMVVGSALLKAKNPQSMYDKLEERI